MLYTDGMDDSYGTAAVCRRGHVRSPDMRISTPGNGSVPLVA